MKFGGSRSLLFSSLLLIACFNKTVAGMIRPFRVVISIINVQVKTGRFDGTLSRTFFVSQEIGFMRPVFSSALKYRVNPFQAKFE